MSGNRFVRIGQLQHNDPKFGRLLAISLALHVVLWLVFQIALSQRFAPPQKTVYYVDLTQLPVKNPRAGRPAPPAPQVKTPPPASRKPSAARAKPKPVPEPVAKSTPRTDTTRDAIEKMRREKELTAREEALRNKLAALTADDTRELTPTQASDAPLGSITGQGDEIGPGQKEWLYTKLKELWNLSRYQVDSLDLEAQIELDFSASGKLLTYRFLERSGNARFDNSLIRVMLKLKEETLPPSFDRRMQVRAIFNLKELLR
ncbi:MAG: hypothetical protein C0624_10375 [Desulfuromonas sp.]|nr:MAG: hypothetical protein C0624_10375 [Desulfuromonas sp.]